MNGEPAAEGGWGRHRYGPLLAIAVVVALVAFALPSALHLPQANPSETAEYAPVPPSDDDSQPPLGNVASLGLASSGGVGADEGDGAPDALVATTTTLPPTPLGGGEGTVPQGKRCVGNPPKQTEDPLSPPCAGYFDGDNGGATYQGVTKEEVRVLWYLDGGGQYLGAEGFVPAPIKKYQDLGEPEDPNDPDDHFVYTRVMRGWQRYFNDRFQTYGRTVHFYVYWSDENEHSPEKRRADAADNYARIKPFAVLSQARANQDDYLEAMAQRGVMNFGSVAGRPASFFQKYPKLVWGYYPSIEQQAAQFSTYICKKVVPFPVSFSGNAEKIGQKRVLGLLYTTDPGHPGYTRFAQLVKQDVEDCGGTFAREHTFPLAGSEFAGNDPPDVIAGNMADFQSQGVTTIIWPQGQETSASGVAQSSNYFPEFVVGGDQTMEGNMNAQRQTGQRAWDHAVVVTNLTALPGTTKQQCYLAYKEADPEAPDQDIFHACNLYRDPFQLFTGIQVAGPRLRPASIDVGFRAIPKIASNDPALPACYYEPDDYTCVKDAQAEWWSSTGQSESSSTPGCWRMMEAGRRSRAGGWPAGDVTAQIDRVTPDPCNNFAGDTHG
jgi:hypothetical protein